MAKQRTNEKARPIMRVRSLVGMTAVRSIAILARMGGAACLSSPRSHDLHNPTNTSLHHKSDMAALGRQQSKFVLAYTARRTCNSSCYRYNTWNHIETGKTILFSSM